MAIPFADILQDGDLPVRVYTRILTTSVYALKGLNTILKVSYNEILHSSGPLPGAETLQWHKYITMHCNL
jgi:hypothetical protein